MPSQFFLAFFFSFQSYEAGNQPLVAFAAVHRKKTMHLMYDLLWYGSQKKAGKKEYVVQKRYKV